MRLAFCLFKYFPYGGLQRDFLRIAKACLARGHMVDVYTMIWDGPYEPGLAIRTIPVKGIRNHSRREDFVKQIQPYLNQGHYDLVVGFNKMPNLDVYYAADTCYQAKVYKQRSWLYRMRPRYRRTKAFEEAVFNPSAKTEILLIAPSQQAEFMHYYKTQPQRFHLLPPGIERDRMAAADATEIRQEVRAEYNLTDADFMLLMIGSGFKTKGLDRALRAIAALPDALKVHCMLYVIGRDNARPFERLAKRLGISNRVVFLGGRKDIPRFLVAADVLLHPAYNENTGTVLLEAVAAGLPVLTTEVCGYAHFIKEAGAGVVLPANPFQQVQFNSTLATMLSSADIRASASWNGLAFAKTADIYSMPERAVSLIESLR